MAHITKPIKEQAENSSFGGSNIVVHELRLIDKNWRNANEDGTREAEFPSRPRMAFK
jgi:hypothetical protein